MKNNRFKIPAFSAVLMGLFFLSAPAFSQVVFSSEPTTVASPAGGGGNALNCSILPQTTQTVPCGSGKTGVVTQHRTGSCDYNTNYVWSMTPWEDYSDSCTAATPTATPSPNPTSISPGTIAAPVVGSTAPLTGYAAMSPADQRAYLTSLGYPASHPLTATVRPADSVGNPDFCKSVPNVVGGYACAAASVPSNYTVGTYSIAFETAACTKKAGAVLYDTGAANCSPPAAVPAVVVVVADPHVEGGTFCSGTALIGWWADTGVQYVKDPVGCPAVVVAPAHIEGGTFCSGFTLTGWWLDTGVQYVKEANSATCGYLPPAVADYEGGTFCSNGALIGWWAITGVQYVKDANASACGGTSPPIVTDPVPILYQPNFCADNLGACGGYEGDPPAAPGDAPAGDAPAGDGTA